MVVVRGLYVLQSGTICELLGSWQKFTQSHTNELIADWGGGGAASDSKRRKNAKDHTKKIRQVNVVHLPYIVSHFGIQKTQSSVFYGTFLSIT